MVTAFHDVPDNILCLLHPAQELEGEGQFETVLERVLMIIGKLWALRRLRQARKLNLAVSGQFDDQNDALRDWAMEMTQASLELADLDTLALSASGNAGFLQLCQPCIRMLLRGATGLTALSIHTSTFPRSILVHHLPLRHLEIGVASTVTHWVATLLFDVSRNRTLESLTIVFNPANEIAGRLDSLQLPDISLRSMPRLRHVRLDNCFPVRELSLPDDCALSLDVACGEGIDWRGYCKKLQCHTTVLRLNTSAYIEQHELQCFTKLQYLELDMEGDLGQNLADLQHIPHVKVIAHDLHQMIVTGGSWQTLELFHFGQYPPVIFNHDSFVRDTRSFTFMVKSQQRHSKALIQRVQDACFRQGKACYVVQHTDKQWNKQTAMGKRVHYDHGHDVILSTSKEVAENFQVVCIEGRPSVSFERGRTLAAREDFWPCDPCASVKTT